MSSYCYLRLRMPAPQRKQTPKIMLATYSNTMNNKQLLSFSSGGRTSGTNSNPTYEIKRGLTAKDRVSIVSTIIPASYYVVNAANNTIDFTENAVVLSATITPGNYNSTTIQTEIITQMNAASTGVFTMGYNESTYHLTWTNDTLTFVIDPTSSASQIIGVTAAQVAALTQTSNDAIELSGPRSIFIESQVLGRGRSAYLVNGEQGRPVLVNIPVSAPTGSIIIWEDASQSNRTYGITCNQINEIDFRLRDINGTELDLNGLEWEITVALDLAYP